MEAKNITRFNPKYLKDGTIRWDEIGTIPEVHSKIVSKRSFPSIGLNKIIVPADYPVDNDVLEQSRKLYAETHEMIPVLLSYGSELISGFEQYKLALELGHKQIPFQQITRQQMNRKEMKKFRNTIFYQPAGNKRYPIRSADGLSIYVSLYEKKQYDKLFRLSRKFGYRCEVQPDLKVIVYDGENNAVCGNKCGVRTATAIKQLEKMLRKAA